jgi:hypothetical protein
LAAKALLLCAGVSADTRGAQACAALPALHASSSARATGLHVSLSPPAEKGELPPACDVAALAVRVQAARALLPHLRFSRNDAVCAFLRCHHRQETLRRELAACPPPGVLPLCAPGVAVSGARTFLTLEAAPPAALDLARTLAAVNRAFAAHGLPAARQPAGAPPHVTVAWAWGAVRDDVASAAAQAEALEPLDACWAAALRDVRLAVGADECVVWSSDDT